MLLLSTICCGGAYPMFGMLLYIRKIKIADTTMLKVIFKAVFLDLT
jgi:hypothetical protein